MKTDNLGHRESSFVKLAFRIDRSKRGANSGVQEFRSSGVQELRSSGAQELRE
jgi:hypothetical protein